LLLYEDKSVSQYLLCEKGRIKNCLGLYDKGCEILLLSHYNFLHFLKRREHRSFLAFNAALGKNKISLKNTAAKKEG